MKNPVWILAFALLIFLSTPAARAQKTSTAEIKRIDSYVKSMGQLTERRKQPDLVFADTGQYDENKPDWRRFESIEALDKFHETQETYTVAYNWRSKTKVVVSNFTFFSPSGDWTQYVEHYFRADGSAAMIKAELRTFMDDCVIKQKYYLDKKGRRIKSTVNYFDLNTNKRKRRCLGTEALKFDYYKSVAKLPFAEILEKK